MTNISNISPSQIVAIWIGIGSVSGALISGFDKISDICDEPTPKYKNAFIERPIRGVYHASRVSGYSGWGAFIGGFTAATAPVSIPLYILWKGDENRSDQSDQSDT